MDVAEVTGSLARHLPGVLRWCGALAKSLRGHNIALSGKHSGSANTDALTLADLTLASLTARSGPGMGKVGDRYIATIQPDSAGNLLLYLHQIGTQGQVIPFCTPAEMSAADSPCGA